MADEKPPGRMKIVVLSAVLFSGASIMLAQNIFPTIEASPDKTMAVVCISLIVGAIAGFFIGGAKAKRSR
jgi:hypothetical protein